MKKAIEVVFPNTRHPLCLWHIMKKVLEKLKSYKEYESMSSSLDNIVYDLMTSEDFKEQRHHWVPVYVKNKFWAGMSTIQRRESMNAFFDGHVNSKATLQQFVEQFENALRNADFDSFSSNVRCATHYDMEKKVSIEIDNAILEYKIAECILIKENKKKTVIFKVRFNEHEIEVNCNCCKFEFRGILCRHALYVLVHHDIDFMPDKYIIWRWRKDVNRCHTRVSDMLQPLYP
ncbi:hypothetical protein FF1_021736 [Malus domestica]